MPAQIKTRYLFASTRYNLKNYLWFLFYGHRKPSLDKFLISTIFRFWKSWTRTSRVPTWSGTTAHEPSWPSSSRRNGPRRSGEEFAIRPSDPSSSFRRTRMSSSSETFLSGSSIRCPCSNLRLVSVYSISSYNHYSLFNSFDVKLGEEKNPILILPSILWWFSH